MQNSQIGQRIRERRKMHSWTQQELAERLHVTEQAVSKWERGLNAPDLSLLEPLAQTLGLTIAELITGEPSACTESTLQNAQVKEILAYAKQINARSTRTRWVALLLGSLLVMAAAFAGWLWWPHDFAPLLGQEPSFALELRPADGGEKQVYTIPAGSQAAEEICEVVQRYTYHHHKYTLGTRVAGNVAYSGYFLGYPEDGDVIVLQTTDRPPGYNFVLTLAQNADWIFISGEIEVLTGRRGDQTAAGLMEELLACVQ